MSERYIPPPPPYQPSIQHDQKVAKEVHTLEPSKTDSSRNEEWNDAKYPMVLTDKVLKEAALHSISKYPARLDGASFRTRPRPLPSRPVDPPGPQDQDKLDAMGEIKQNHHPIKLRSTASMQFTAPSLGEPMRRPSSAVQPSPSQSYDRRRTLDDRWPVSAYPPIDPGVESHFRCSSHAPLQSAPHGRPLKNTFGMRLSFDPSVAYTDSQANIPTTLLSRRDSVASLYA